MSENDPYGSEGGASNDRPYPYPAPRFSNGPTTEGRVQLYAPTRADYIYARHFGNGTEGSPS